MTSIKAIIRVGRPWGVQPITPAQRLARDQAHEERKARQALRDAKNKAKPS